MTAQHPPHTVRTESDSTPLGTRQLRRDAVRSEAGMTEREREHPLLDERRRRVRHPRCSTFAWPQDLQPEAQHLASPPVIARWVDTHHPTRQLDVPELLSQRE